MAVAKTHEFQFRPRARLVSILGEHLISDHAVGLIELVKNAYDADATEVTVEISGIKDTEKSTVVIADNGCGMTVDDIRHKWLSPAVDHKEREKRENRRTGLGRLPIGEKGVGRFAVHQLGKRLEMVTRTRGGPEVVLNIDWDAFDSGDGFLDAVAVNVIERDPELFTNGQTGTQLLVRTARAAWTEKLLKKLHRTLRRLQSPLTEEDQRFRIQLRCQEFREIENIDPTDILPKAHYEFRGLVNENGKCDLEYSCKHPAVKSREQIGQGIDLVPLAGDELQAPTPRCGPFYIDLYVWDRSKDYLHASDVSKGELDALSGVSVFRDGLRVLPYGEPGDDWLLLDQERVQAPSERISNNQVIGLVQFDQSTNLQLRDKTNREGLIENDAFLDLRALVRAAIRQFIKYWKNDRPAARESKTGMRGGDIRGARVVATALRGTTRDDVEVKIPQTGIPATDDRGGSALGSELSSDGTVQVSQRRAVDLIIQHIDGTEHSIRERDRELDTLLQLAGTGLAAERVVHEFGRHIGTAVEALGVFRKRREVNGESDAALTKIEASLETLRTEFRILAPYEMTGPAPRARRISIREIAELAIELNGGLLSRWNIASAVEGNDWQAKVKPTPLLQILDNLVHNACSWLSAVPVENRRLGIVLVPDACRVLVVDSGSGVDPEIAPHVFEPFVSLKAGGKGLGLHISSELAAKLGGKLRLAGPGDAASTPAWATGAVFALELDPATRVHRDEPEEESNG